MKLLLARHARPIGADGLCYGRLDLPADADATRLAARALAAVVAPGAPLFMSSRQRARQLALALHALRPDLPAPRADARFDEMDFGRHEGRPWADIPRAAVDAWVADFAAHRFGGAESAAEVLRRVAAGLAALPAAPLVVVVAHAGVIRAARFLASAGAGALPASAADWPADGCGHGEWLLLDRPG